MKTILFIILFGLIFLPLKNYSGYGGQNGLPLFQLNQEVSAETAARILKMVESPTYLKADDSIIRNILAEKQAVLRLELPLSEQLTVMAELQRFKVLAPDARIVAGTDDGDQPLSFRDKFIAYTGKIAGEEDSFISLNFSPAGVIGTLSWNKVTYTISPLKVNGKFSTTEYVLYPLSRVKIKPDFYCDTELMTLPDRLLGTLLSLPTPRKDITGSDLLEVEMAIESDYDTYEAFGNSTEATTAYLLSLMSTVSSIYTRDVNVKLVVSYLRIWTTPSDPYNGTTSFALLDEFRSYWNSNMQAVHRDLAHYISVRPGGLGGVAWLGVLCDSPTNGHGYAFSDISGSFNGLLTYSWDVDVVSHETGHNFGSLHTHSCYWPGGPIDTCVVTSENDFCVSTPSPVPGTIMSYCHLSYYKVLNFHPLPISVMRTNAEQAPCVSVSALPVAILTPNGGETFRTESSVPVIWGTSLTGMLNIEFSPDSGTTWLPVDSNIPATQRTYTWTVQYVPTTHRALLRIYDSTNPQAQDISDHVFTIKTQLWEFENLFPQLYSTFQVGPNDTTRLRFVWSSAGNVPGITYRIRLFSDPAHRAYFPADNSGADTVATLTGHQVDSLLSSWNAWATGDSVRIRWAARAYYQSDSLQAFPLQTLFFKRNPSAIVTDINTALPARFALYPNYPNPFNPATEIRYAIPQKSQVVLVIYNSLGQQVRMLVNERQNPGVYTSRWDGTDDRGKMVPSGVYLYRLQAEDRLLTGKMLLLR